MELNVIDILENCPLFAQVNDEGFRRLFAVARLTRFRKGQMIFQQGQACPGMYVVGSGLVRVFKRGSQGQEKILHLVGPGETFAEVAALGKFDCPASAEAISATTCAFVPIESLQQMIRENHELCRQLLMGLCLWVRRLVDLVEDLTLRDATGRVARFLLSQVDNNKSIIRLRGLKRHLAAQLDLTSETLSRTLRRLEMRGLIRHLSRSELQILDQSGLAKLAELQ
ncbi:MAG: Crp/Fnr family transcriptional regulator [Thermogutta sp.]